MKMNGLPKFKSIHTSIAIAFSSLIICAVLAMSFNSFLLSSEAVKRNSYEHTGQLVEQVNANVETYVGNMESIAELALADEKLRTLMRLHDADSPEGLALTAEVSAFFGSIVRSREDIASILFIGSNGSLVSNREEGALKPYHELMNQDWYTAAKKAGGESVISSSRIQHLFEDEYRWVVSISREAERGTDGSGGVLLVDLNYNVINDLCKQIHMGNRGYVFLLDPTGDPIYHPQQQLIYSGLKSERFDDILQAEDGSFEADSDGAAKLYTVRTSEFGWKVIGVNYPEELVGDKKEIALSALRWGLICLVFGLALSLWLSHKLTKPVKKLDVQMKKVERGDFAVRAEIESPNEIGKLARTFNLMTGKIKDLMEQVMREQEDKRISELKALQAQIHPHFLYNTLDSIIWMAEMDKRDDVIRMTSALSKLLRSSISKGEELVPLRQELAHAEHYLVIQSMRYRGKFAYSIEVEEGLLDQYVLKVLLQPLVENAIYHGIKNKADQGRIVIRGTACQDGLCLQVEDDGVGADAEKVKERLARGRLYSGKSGSDGGGSGPSGSCGLGLDNVDHRIRLNYGEPYGLHFESERDEGTTVTLRLPLLRESVGSSPDREGEG